MNELLRTSATELARRIRKREISPLEVVEAHINRIEEVNSLINAVVEPCFDLAMDQAKAAQEKLARTKDDLPPFFGVPCTIKDTFAVAGMPWSGGSLFRKSVIAGEDASLVKRMKATGAIILGKTNVPEAALWIDSINKVYGPTKNPRDLNRIAGGSSGGEGAIIAAAGSPMGLASDIGGSIRFPSFFNGVCGHKPSGRLTPQTGHWPPAAGSLAPYMTGGPMTRKVEDLMPLLKLLVGPDGIDKSVEERRLGDPDAVRLKGMKIFFYTDNGVAKANSDVQRGVLTAASALESRGCIVEEWKPKGISNSAEIWAAAMALGEESNFEEMAFAGVKPNLFRESAKMLLGKGEVGLPVLTLVFLEKITKKFPDKLREILKKADALRDVIENRLGENGVLIAPPFGTPAPIRRELWRLIASVSYSAIFNVLEFPVTTIPVTWTRAGLPVGVQIIGKRMDDHVTIAVAKALEQDLGGWRPARAIL